MALRSVTLRRGRAPLAATRMSWQFEIVFIFVFLKDFPGQRAMREQQRGGVP